MTDALEKTRDAMARAYYARDVAVAIEAMIDVKVNAILDAREAKAEPAFTGRPPESVIAEKDRDISRMQDTITEACARIAELERERDELADANRSVGISRFEAEAALAELRGVALQWKDRSDRPDLQFAGATIMSLLSPEGEAKGEVQPPRDADPVPGMEYFYRMSGCPATLPSDPDCICWHRQGTGPRPDIIPEEVSTWRPARSAGITQGGTDG